MGGPHVIGIVNQYKHLGTVAHRDGAMAPEIKARAQSIRAAAAQLRPKFLSNRSVPVQAKCNVLTS
eukprot:6024982-Karenia_brevis.AAC.1